MPWYQYNGGDVSNPNNYTLVPNPVNLNCPTTKEVLCAIQATDNAGKPNLVAASPGIYIEISNAMTTRLESTNVKLRPF